MKTIWKVPLKAETSQMISVPYDATLLCAREQNNVPCVWFLCDPGNVSINKQIHIFGTGHDVSDSGRELRYLGSCHLDGGSLVFHVFEEARQWM